MPLYEYKCKECGLFVEKIQKVNDRPLEKCSRCGGVLEKVISSPAIQFKGTGWYVTDYAKKEKKREEIKHVVKSKKDASPPKKTPAKEKEAQPAHHAHHA